MNQRWTTTSASRDERHSSRLRTAFVAPYRRLGFLWIAAFALPAAGGNWPAWRGPDGNGICRETKLPLHWSANQNVRWQVPLPDRGNSTPIVWGQRVFITQAICQGKEADVRLQPGDIVYVPYVPYRKLALFAEAILRQFVYTLASNEGYRAADLPIGAPSAGMAPLPPAR
jgi:hypothetical protein